MNRSHRITHKKYDDHYESLNDHCIEYNTYKNDTFYVAITNFIKIDYKICYA